MELILRLNERVVIRYDTKIVSYSDNGVTNKKQCGKCLNRLCIDGFVCIECCYQEFKDAKKE